MPITVRDACKIRDGAFDFIQADQIEDIATLIREEGDGTAFFAKNVVTKGMDRLLRGVLNRLAGKGDNAVYQLTQAMGGGKTHAMIALGLLARSDVLRNSVVPDIAAAAGFLGAARVVALSGRNKPKRFLWGEIADQLGAAKTFERFWRDGPDAPDERAWLEILTGQPTLIMLDELPPYFDYARTRIVGNGTLATVTTYALGTLLTAALKCSNCAVVVSNLSGAYAQASADLARVMKDFEGELNRSAVNIQPVDLGSEEVFSILKKRIFAELPSAAEIDRVADAYGRAIEDAERGQTIARSAERIADQVHASYPFHPSLKDLLALFKSNERYRQTRGLIRIVARLVKCVWDRPQNDVHLIGAQHFDLSDPDVKNAVLEIADLDSAIATDIASGGAAHAELIDADIGSDAASQVARLILFSSLSTAVDAVKGIDRQRILEFLLTPDRPASEFAAALDSLKEAAWYLHPGRGDRWYFSATENLRKRLQVEAERMQDTKVLKEMRRRLETMFEVKKGLAYQEVMALPEIERVQITGDKRVLLMVSPDARQPPDEVKRFHDALADKNAVCFLTGEGDGFVRLEDCVRDILAVEKIKGEIDDKSPLWRELEERGTKAEVEFNGSVSASLTRLWYPMRTGLASTKLSLVFSANKRDGEDQVEQALSAIPVGKLVTDVEADYDSLVDRAEEVLFGAGVKDMSMSDLRARARSAMRWPWLPPKGLQELVRIAVARGRWRQADERVLVGPFGPDRTSVRVVEAGYDDRKGEARLSVVAENAGRAAVIRWSESGPPDERAPVLNGADHATTATEVWFLAVDPTGEHPTGEPVRWQNRLTIRHQVRDIGTAREIELEVVPRGEIRFTIDGANPKVNGTAYSGPFQVDGKAFVLAVHAKDGAVETTREFRVPARSGNGHEIDLTLPVTVRGSLGFHTATEAFQFLSDQAIRRARLRNVALAVGEGSENARLRFGSTVSLAAAAVDASIAALRQALAKESAEIDLQINEISFETGQDFQNFVRNLKIDASALEVSQ